jgi:hypothetical protein
MAATMTCQNIDPTGTVLNQCPVPIQKNSALSHFLLKRLDLSDESPQFDEIAVEANAPG